MSGFKVSLLASKDLDEIWFGAANHEGVDYASRVPDWI